jgi:hypothetical protein
MSIPRPNETEEYGLANACRTCHADKPPGWEQQALLSWECKEALEVRPWVGAIQMAKSNDPWQTEELLLIIGDETSGQLLVASALGMLRNQPRDPSIVPVLDDFASHSSESIRAAALTALAVHDTEKPSKWIERGSKDQSPFVRIATFELAAAMNRLSDSQMRQYRQDVLRFSIRPPVRELQAIAEMQNRRNEE